MESLSNPKKWSEISKKIPGRTQHQVKNRFIRLLANEIEVKRDIIRRSLNENSFYGLLFRVLEELRMRKKSQVFKNFKNDTEMQESNEMVEKNENEFEFSEGILSGK